MLPVVLHRVASKGQFLFFLSFPYLLVGLDHYYWMVGLVGQCAKFL